MLSMPKRMGRIVPVLTGLIVAAAATGLQAGDSDEYRKLLGDKASVLVTVKYVLKVKMGGMMGAMGDQESENEITGVMIDPKGLVLCSNTRLGGFTALLNRMMGSMMGGSISATPTDLRVLVGDDVEGREAELLARDTELDLAWVRIKEPADKPFDHLDFSKGVTTGIGQHIVALRRLDKYFARETVVVEGRIGGMVTKPRDLYVPSLDIAMAQGLPVYTADGKVVGVTITQMPDAQDAGSNPNLLAMLSNLSGMQDMMSGLILPAADVAKATRRALASAETD